MGEIGKAALSGPAIVIIQIMFVALATWIAGYFASAVGKGQFANLINVAGVFAGLLLVLSTIIKALVEAGRALGVGP